MNDHHCSPRTKLNFSNLFSNYFLTDIVNLEIEERASTPFFVIRYWLAISVLNSALEGKLQREHPSTKEKLSTIQDPEMYKRTRDRESHIDVV
jgi:hypothetical protein